MTTPDLDLCFPAPDDAPAILCEEEALTYGELRGRAAAFATWLRQAGLGPGDRFAFMLANGPDVFAAYMACARTGIVGVPLSQRLTDAELRFQIADSGAAAVVFGEEHAPAVARVRPGLPGPAAWSSAGALRRDGLDLRDIPAPPTHPGDAFCIMYTGGTTGTPKAAVQTRGGWACCLRATVEAWGATAQDRHLLSLPMSHAAWFSGGATLCAGGRVTILRAWDPAHAIDVIARQRITTLNMIPTMLGDIVRACASGHDDLRSVRILTVAGSLLPAAIHARARDIFGPVIGNIYGLTEAAGPVTFLMPGDMEGERRASVGRPNPYVELAILGDDGLPTDGAAPGEIGLAGPQVTPGYWRREAETREAFAGRWFRTGDIARLDADGFVHLVDRKKDMIKSGGYNVYPSEVEQVVYAHPAVLECAVFGVPDPRWIEAVHAAVVLRPGHACTPQELIETCRAGLSAHKVPKAIHIVDGIPRTRFGKFDRAATLRLIQG